MDPASAAPQDDSPRVLVVDDEKVIREILSDFLTMEGYVVRAVEDGAAALKELRLRPYDLVISDLKMPNMGGLELLEKMAEQRLEVLTIIMTGFGTVETAIEAMKKGAYDYILKPFKVEEVVHVVQRGLDRQRLQAENIRLREALSLYRVSEAVAASLDLDRVLEVIVDSVLQEVAADVVSLHLQDPRTGQFDERIKRVAHRQRRHVCLSLDERRIQDDVQDAIKRQLMRHRLRELIQRHRLFEEEVLLLKLLLLERLVDDPNHILVLERLEDVVIGPALHRLDGRLDGPKRGHDDRDHRQPLLGDALQQLQPVHVRHLQVGQDQVIRAPLQLLQGLQAVLGKSHRKALSGEHVHEHFTHDLLIIDQKNSRWLVGSRRIHGARIYCQK